MVADPVGLSPYSDAAFTSVLDNSRTLQWPVSGNACMTTATLQGFSIDRDNFFRDGEGRMAFTYPAGVVDDDSAVTTRMELRGFSFGAASTNQVWDGSFQLPDIAGRSPSFTLGQVFSETEGAPILRIAVIASRAGLNNRIWAVYRRALGDGNTIFTDLGPAPTGMQIARIRITYNSSGGIDILSSASNQTVRLTDNFGFWNAPGKLTYFKAGCYLQDPGGCDVRFVALGFDR